AETSTWPGLGPAPSTARPEAALTLRRSENATQAAAATRMAPRVQPSALVGTPTYLRPEAKITNVMTGLMYLSGALDDSSEPIRTAGTLPRMIETVMPNST